MLGSKYASKLDRIARSGPIVRPALRHRRGQLGQVKPKSAWKGTFLADRATASPAAIPSHASKVPDLFQTEEDDPKSEPTPTIRPNFDDFTTKAVALEAIAHNRAH